MEQTKYERTLGHCLKMTARYEHDGYIFYVRVELGKLTISQGAYRCNFITARLEGSDVFLYRTEVHTDDETIAAIEACIKNVKERISASKKAMSRIETDLMDIGFSREENS